MNEKKSPRPIRAGQAYLDAIQDDPQAQQALARTMLKLRLLAESLRAVGTSQREVLDLMQGVSSALRGVWPLVRQQGLEKLLGTLRSEQEQVFQQLTAEITASSDTVEVELGAHGFEPPRDLAGWEELARIVEREPGAQTIEGIYRWAIAWAKREILRCRIARGDLPAPGGSGALEADPQMPSDAGIRRDEHDPKIASCLGKRIYLGHDTQVSRLFWLLAEAVGRARSLAEVQRAVDGMETTRDMDATGDEFQRASQRVRKAIAKLRQALRENRADTHLLIVRPRRRPHPGIHDGAALWRAALNRIPMHLVVRVVIPNLASGAPFLVDDRDEIVPGLHAHLTGGHTRGHLALVFESAGQSAIYLGDICPSTAHLRRMWNLAYDTFPLDTRRRKPQLLGEAADRGAWVLWNHDPTLAVSRIVRDARREFVPFDGRDIL